MRLSQSTAFSKQRRNKKLGSNSRSRKKHKRLDAICEKAYSRNHSTLESESTECNVGGGSIANESELRRSSRARRAPVLLDSSPPPPKKRLKIDKGCGIGYAESTWRKERVKSESPCSTSGDLEEELGNWRSRLRSRPNNVGFRVRGRGMGDSSPKGKRKLFEESDGFKDGPKLEVGELNDKNAGFAGGKLTVVKSHRPGKIKASNVSRNEHQEVGSGSFVEELKEKNDVDLLEDKGGNSLLLDSGVKGGNEGGVQDNMASKELVVERESECPIGLHLEEYVVNDNGQSMENVNVVEQPCNADEVENIKDALAVDGAPSYQAEDGRSHEKPLEGDISEKVDTLNYPKTDALGKPRIKKGRRCGLCGGGTDGKPPKVLVQDGAGSDNEAYCGSSASEEPNYDMWDGFGDEPGWLGRLLGPINDRFGIAGIWVHQHCAVWSPEGST